MHMYMHVLYIQTSDASGEELSQLNSSLQKSNEEVGGLVSYWADLLKASLATANKFDQDYK